MIEEKHGIYIHIHYIYIQMKCMYTYMHMLCTCIHIHICMEYMRKIYNVHASFGVDYSIACEWRDIATPLRTWSNGAHTGVGLRHFLCG